MTAGGIGVTLATGGSSAETGNPNRTVSVADYSVTGDNLEATIWEARNKINKESTAEIGLNLNNTSNKSTIFSFTCENSVNAIKGERNRGNVHAVLVGSLNSWESKDGKWFVTEDEIYPDDPNQDVSTTLQKDQSYRMQYQLWAREGNPYLPPGTYTFSRDLSVDNKAEQLSMRIDVETK